MGLWELHVRPSRLSAERTQSVLSDEAGHWQELESEHPQGATQDAFVGYAPWGNGRRGDVMLCVETFDRGAGRLLNVQLGFCQSDTSSCVERMAGEVLQRDGQVVLPSDVSVSHVYSGDYGHDGRSDLLIQLSNGASLLLRSGTAAVPRPRLVVPPI